MVPLDPFEIELIITLSNEFSLAATATRLGVTPSAISQRLEKIEERLGCRVANRKGRVSFTPAGEVLLQACIDANERFVVALHQVNQISAPQLRVIADQSLLITDVAEALSIVRQEIPDLKIVLRTGTFSEIAREVILGNADAGIIAKDPHVTGLQLRPYRRERICLLVPIDHALAKKQVIHFREALPYPIIHSANLEHITKLMFDEAKATNKTLQSDLLVPNFEIQARYVALNIGIAPTLESVAVRYATNHPFKLVRLLDDWTHHILYVCVSERGSVTDATNSLVRNLVKLHTAQSEFAPGAE